MSNDLVFYVDEQPSDPLVVTVRDPDGVPVDLSDVITVEFVGGALPDGEAVVNNAAEGKVQYTFSAPFTEAGVLSLQVKMIDTVNGVDFSTPFNLVVADPAEEAELLVSAVEVEAWTGAPVSVADISRAQAIVGLACGRNLNDTDWLATLSTTDSYWLSLATAYQAVEVRAAQEGVVFPYVPGASSISTGDVSVSYRADANSDVVGLGNLARTAVSRLSWLRSFRSVQAAPFTRDPLRPSVWRNLTPDRTGWFR